MMRHPVRHSVVAIGLLLTACKATTKLPVRRELITLPTNVDQLVCHVRGIAAQQRLSFHYGTFPDTDGSTAVTFRLIGNTFELTLAKFELRGPYDLRAYDLSADGTGRQSADRAFEHFKSALTEPVGSQCTTEH
jgi:hypothetical protein